MILDTEQRNTVLKMRYQKNQRTFKENVFALMALKEHHYYSYIKGRIFKTQNKEFQVILSEILQVTRSNEYSHLFQSNSILLIKSNVVQDKAFRVSCYDVSELGRKAIKTRYQEGRTFCRFFSPKAQCNPK